MPLWTKFDVLTLRGYLHTAISHTAAVPAPAQATQRPHLWSQGATLAGANMVHVQAQCALEREVRCVIRQEPLVRYHLYYRVL